MEESGAVYFLGDKYVDRVVRDGEVVYGRNLLLKTSGTWIVSSFHSWVNRSLDIPFEKINAKRGDTFTISESIDSTESTLPVTTGFSELIADGVNNLFLGESIQNAIKVINATGKTSHSTAYGIRIFYLRQESGTNTNIAKYRKTKLELGATATPYTVAPEDLFPSAQTLPSFPEWPEEGGGY